MISNQEIDRRRFCTRILTGSLAAAVSVAVPGGGAWAAKKKRRRKKKKSSPSFFRSRETKSSNMKPFKKWTGALKRYSKEAASAKKGTCKSKTMNECHYQEWTKFLISVKDKGPKEKILAINSHMNKAKYILDKTNWGIKDYWATPFEFMKRFGDCEDYAIAKYMSLRRLGFKNNQLRVVAVKDMNLKVGHAVLVVYLGGKTLLLDNQIKQVVSTKKVRHYQPVFSINEKNWWRHRVVSG